MIKTIRFVKTVTIDIETDQILSVIETVESGDSSITMKDQKSKKSVSKVIDTSCDVELLNGKLQLSYDATEKLGAVVGDRSSINYINRENEFIPVISRSSVFGDTESGNKLTKALSVSFKGKQLASLKQYGTKFNLLKHDFLPESVFVLVDPNATQMDNIKEDELDEVDINYNEAINENSEIIVDNLDVESENIITFDFNLG